MTSVTEKVELGPALARFGLTSFRPGQDEVIRAVLDGRDVLCVMPTGGGKSLCYQLPSLLLPGITLVISPLIALMKDQEDQLLRLGMRASTLHSGIDLGEQRERLARMQRGQFDLVYVAPERLRSQPFLEALREVGVARMAIDEAHCISEWGHDFRPDYARLGWFRRQMGSPPTIALTATATDQVRRDIVEQLRLGDPAIFVRGFDRPNLSYHVWLTPTQEQKHDRLLRILRQTPGASILYTSSRKSCDKVADFLRQETNRRVAIYHAGMTTEDRRQQQDAFMNDAADIVVATNAFGMGIDKPDIRSVIHYNLTGTMEAYYQEAGRAGRDGKPARCDLLFAPIDRRIQEFFIENEYPDRTLAYALLEMLRDEPTDPIELTREDLTERLGGRVAEMAVGTCLKLLEQAGAIERLRPRENQGILRIHETGPDLTDLVPAKAKLQQGVLKALDGMVGKNRGQDVYFHPDGLAKFLGIDRAALTRALRELTERLRIEYIPPFRGNAIRILDRQTKPRELPIDFDELARRKRRELEKLDRVFDYAQGPGCRRQFILTYFGDKAERCGRCDNCDHDKRRGARDGRAADGPADAARTAQGNGPLAAIGAGVWDEDVARALRGILGAIAELRGRFGKGVVAQTLAGSTAKTIERFGLHKRPFFGSLKHLRQQEVVAILDALLAVGAVEQGGDRLRPTLVLSRQGTDMARTRTPLPPHLPIPPIICARLAENSHAAPPARPAAPAKPAAAPTPATPKLPAAPPALPGPPKGSPSPSETDWTCRLLDLGLSLADCAAARRLSTETVLRHVLAALHAGHAVRLDALAHFPFAPHQESLAAELRPFLAGARRDGN